LQIIRPSSRRTLKSRVLTQLTMLFCKRLTNSLLRHLIRLPRGSWFRCPLFDTIWWVRWQTNWNIANGSLAGDWRLRNRPESLHQDGSWFCFVPSSTRVGNILSRWMKPGFMSRISKNKYGSRTMKTPNNWTLNDHQSENNAGRGVESTWVPLGQCSAQEAEVDGSILHWSYSSRDSRFSRRKRLTKISRTRWQCQATRRKKSETISGRKPPEERTTSTLLPGPSAERVFLFGQVKLMLQGTEIQTAEELLDVWFKFWATFHSRRW
jgi:hypothetical protein